MDGGIFQWIQLTLMPSSLKNEFKILKKRIQTNHGKSEKQKLYGHF